MKITRYAKEIAQIPQKAYYIGKKFHYDNKRRYNDMEFKNIKDVRDRVKAMEDSKLKQKIKNENY